MKGTVSPRARGLQRRWYNRCQKQESKMHPWKTRPSSQKRGTSQTCDPPSREQCTREKEVGLPSLAARGPTTRCQFCLPRRDVTALSVHFLISQPTEKLEVTTWPIFSPVIVSLLPPNPKDGVVTEQGPVYIGDRLPSGPETLSGHPRGLSHS